MKNVFHVNNIKNFYFLPQKKNSVSIANSTLLLTNCKITDVYSDHTKNIVCGKMLSIFNV